LIFDSSPNGDQKVQADTKRLKKLIDGNGGNSELTVENLLQLHQMDATEIPRSSR
jgi:hypothetical protein